MKIDAPKFEVIGVTAYWAGSPSPPDDKYRAVRESDWRKIMAVVRQAECATNAEGGLFWKDAKMDSVVALRKHLAKRENRK